MRSLTIRSRNRIPALLAVLVLTPLFFASCTRESGPPSSAGKVPPQFMIGIPASERLLQQYERYEPFARYLSGEAGIDVRLHFVPAYHSLARSFDEEKLDAAFFGGFGYFLAHRRDGVRVIARMVDLQGNSTYSGVLFVRKGGGIRSCGDMRGKTLASVNRESYAGMLTPAMYFLQAGVDPATHLKAWYYSGTHEAAIMDVLQGRAEIGASRSTDIERLAAGDPRIQEQLTELARSPEVPDNSVAVRRDLDPEIAARVTGALLRMHESSAGKAALAAMGGVRFIATRDEDFGPVDRYTRTLGAAGAAGREKAGP